MIKNKFDYVAQCGFNAETLKPYKTKHVCVCVYKCSHTQIIIYWKSFYFYVFTVHPHNGRGNQKYNCVGGILTHTLLVHVKVKYII